MTIPVASAQKGALIPPAPLAGFPPDEFRRRREALRARCPEGILLVRGATENEVVAPGVYRQSSAFFYLTGVETPGAFLVLLPEGVPPTAGLQGVSSETREILFLPTRDPVAETWTGPKLGPGAETEAATGIAKAADANRLWDALTNWLRRKSVLFTLTPFGEGAKLTREYALMQHITELVPIVQFRDLSPALAQLRVVKSSLELSRLQEAIAVTREGHIAARSLIANGAGKSEAEVESAVFTVFRRSHAGVAFASIVGSGANGTVLHYEDNRHPLQAGDLVVVDVGARVGHYCGDLTRTYPVGGRFSLRQREIYSLVLEAHRRAVAEYRPGEDTLRDLTERCKAFFREQPLRAQDLAGVEHTLDVFMPHGLSHHLGLDVHDVGDREVPLAPGNVITVEPGLYLPTEGIGVRLEDDYLVTETGLERLGPELEMEIDAIEAVMRP